MMSPEEMKLAVCEKLPELVALVQCNCGLKSCSILHKPKPYWIGCKETGGMNRRINWPTEGLQVCHEAEKQMYGDKWQDYMKQLATICNGWGNAYHSTYEQRLEALCRVWFPERF